MKPPIFVIGAPRSGTTLLRLMLDSHPEISCGPETHFLGDMKKIVTNYWEMIENYGHAEEYWYDKIREFYCSFQEEYALKRNRKRWAEKTPSYTLHLEFLNRLFPTCQFVHIIRNPKSVVASHLDRWGYVRAFHSISTWKTFIRKARDFSRLIDPSRYYEIRYERLIANPEDEMKGLLEFLDEKWTPSVLEYDVHPHDAGQYVRDFAKMRQDELSSPERFYKSRIEASWNQIGISLMLITIVRTKTMRRELGY